MADILSSLPRLTINDLEIVVISSGSSVDFDLAMNKPVYKNNAIIDFLGSNNRKFTYTLGFYEGIKGYEFAFSSTFPKFKTIIESGNKCELRDPILGTFQVYPTKYSISSDVNKRNGISVDIEFVHAPEIDEAVKEITSVEGVKSKSAQMAQAALSTPTLPTSVLTEILSIVNDIQNLGDTVTVAILLTVGKLESARFKLEKIAKTVERLTDPQSWVLLRAINAVIDTINFVEGIFTSGDQYGIYLVEEPITLLRLAAKLNMSASDLQKLNPSIKKIVPQNYQVVYKRG